MEKDKGNGNKKKKKAQLNFCGCQRISPEPIAPPSFQRLSKSAVFAIRNGWFSHSKTERLAPVTM